MGITVPVRLRLPNNMRVQVMINGYSVPSNVKLLNNGSMATCLWRAWQDFLIDRQECESQGKPLTIGRLARYRDEHGNCDVDIQIDLM